MALYSGVGGGGGGGGGGGAGAGPPNIIAFMYEICKLRVPVYHH